MDLTGTELQLRISTPQLLGEHDFPFHAPIPAALRIVPVDKLTSVCCLLIRTELPKYFNWQYPKSKLPEYSRFFLSVSIKGKQTANSSFEEEILR